MVLTDGPALGRVRRRGHEDTLNPCIEDVTDWVGLDWIGSNCRGMIPKRDVSVEFPASKRKRVGLRCWSNPGDATRATVSRVFDHVSLNSFRVSQYGASA